MRPSQRLAAALVGVGAAVLVVWVSLQTRPWSGDYDVTGSFGADNAGPPLTALVHGQWSRFVHAQTLMGVTSELWRAPFLAFATLLGAGDQTGYEVGAIACLLPLIALIIWVATRDLNWRQLGLAIIAGLVMITGPATAEAVIFGHPEEILTIVLATIAVLAAQADRRTWAAVALGLSIGSKEWAILTIPAVLVALRGGRWRALAIAATIAILATATLPVLDFSAFHRAEETVGPTRTENPLSLWWPLTSSANRELPLDLNRGQASLLALLTAAGLIAVAGRRLRARASAMTAPIDAMALLSLAGLLRCLCDPSDYPYYLVAAVIPLAVWETGIRRRLPTTSLLLWFVQALCDGQTVPFGLTVRGSSGATALVAFLNVGLLLVGYLTLRTFVAGPARRLEPVRSGAASREHSRERAGADVAA